MTAAYSPAALIPVGLHLPYLTDETDVRAVLAQAAMAGADPNLLRDAWQQWRAERQRSVVTLEGVLA